jgi:glyoxylase-like metal-dependent hydrolase (beta-lactamase superfamily II)
MVYGEVVTLSPLVRRVLCQNPNVFTGPGTNTYLVGGGDSDIAVIDPGPDDHEEHLDAVAAAADGRIKWILVTHTHLDHSPGAKGLKERTGAQVLGFDERDGFVPDEAIGDGYTLDGPGFGLRAIHTPGHASNHLCYRLAEEDLLFSGDHIMSGSTVVIAPPDGDMGAYLKALEELRQYRLTAIAPGHGPWIDDPWAKVDEYITHRLLREQAIVSALAAAGRAKVEEIVEAVYTDVPAELHPIARFSVWAHLRKLAAEGAATADDPDQLDTLWSVAKDGVGPHD